MSVIAAKEVFSEEWHEKRGDGSFALEEEGDGDVDPETGGMMTRFVGQQGRFQS
jgi:hypothetical protein